MDIADIADFPVSSPVTAHELHQAAVELVTRGRAAGRTVATAESLTAGLVAATIAEVPGASAVLRGGLVVYATDLKATLAGVPAEILQRHGAVAPETAWHLAAGAAARCGADVGIGLTGVAGPDPQEGKPVGTVFIGVGAGDHTRVHRLVAQGSRAQIRAAAAWCGLQLAAELL